MCIRDRLGIQGSRFFGYEHNMEPKPVEAASPAEVAAGNLHLTDVYKRQVLYYDGHSARAPMAPLTSEFVRGIEK